MPIMPVVLSLHRFPVSGLRPRQETPQESCKASHGHLELKKLEFQVEKSDFPTKIMQKPYKIHQKASRRAFSFRS